MTFYASAESEDYMNEEQIKYFRNRLLDWRSELIAGSEEVFLALKEADFRKPDLLDLGGMQAEKARQLGTRKKLNQMIAKIEHALDRINNGTYGYCEATGEEIGLNRLEALPLATLSVEAQEQLERNGSIYH